MCKGLAEKPCSCLEWVKEMRSSIGTLLHKVEIGQHAVTTGYFSWYIKNKSNSRNAMKEYMSWKDSFNKLLRSKEGISAFRAFLQTEFSEENLEFWVACEDYRRTRSTAKLQDKAERIFQEFLQSGAPREVNVDHQTREVTRKQITVACRSCFDEAQEQTRILMEKDSYPRFLKSPYYRELLSQSSLRTITLSSS
ncbi:regulator of G-protein signaling 16-like [Bombina bombina]|uniref:regulator of G-protein signaling 16-like n=1 Tax=Bombina bombina TaxID=8345 RepID=UPI00235AC262|nr:regulator of G-protein signaling 16-like [Bombina bombina]